MNRLIHKGTLLLALGLLLGLASWHAQGPLPGDIAITRAMQALFGSAPAWADLVTRAATEPWMWLLAGAVALALGMMAGSRMALVAVLAFSVSIALDALLRFFIHVPRPAATLVAVARPSATSGLPSSFGLIGGATMGLLLLLALEQRKSTARTAAILVAAIALLAGLCARVTMGGHWTSQVLASYAVAAGLAWSLRRGMVAGRR